MIKFFRQFRRTLINSNRFTRYLVYAIGEIILVVIGILIALQINNWNQHRQDRKQESQILLQLLNEYHRNLDQINSKIDVRDDIVQSAFSLLEYRNQEVSEINPDTFNIHMSRIITRPTFDPELGVTHELSNSGKLYLLTNEELRGNLTGFTSFLSELREEEMATFNFVENILIPFLNENYRMGRVAANFIDDEIFQSKFALSTFNKGNSIKDLFSQGNMEPLITSMEFENHLAIIIGGISYTNIQSQGVKQRIEDIIRLIESEIDKPH